MTTTVSETYGEAVMNDIEQAGQAPTPRDLLEEAHAEHGAGIDAFLLGWFTQVAGADAVAEAIAAYKATRPEETTP